MVPYLVNSNSGIDGFSSEMMGQNDNADLSPGVSAPPCYPASSVPGKVSAPQLCPGSPSTPPPVQQELAEREAGWLRSNRLV